MKANEVRKMSAAELESKLVDLKKDLFNLRLQDRKSTRLNSSHQ